MLIRTYFSTRLLWAAFRASEQARAIEETHPPAPGPPKFSMEHSGLVLSSIVSSVAFLEAAVNEFFQDAHDGHGLKDDGYIAPLPAGAVDAMAAVWEATEDGRTLRLLEKWQLLLRLAEKDPLDTGRAPFQDAKLVLDLRNVIVHYRPEDLGVEEHKLERRLKGKFEPNALWAEASGGSWWPNGCLGHGCAKWAATSVVAFADRVCGEVGIDPNYRRIAEGGSFGKAPY